VIKNNESCSNKSKISENGQKRAVSLENGRGRSVTRPGVRRWLVDVVDTKKCVEGVGNASGCPKMRVKG
jgi:hypothetical protein